VIPALQKPHSFVAGLALTALDRKKDSGLETTPKNGMAGTNPGHDQQEAPHNARSDSASVCETKYYRS
jgi:hypothetical protein